VEKTKTNMTKQKLEVKTSPIMVATMKIKIKGESPLLMEKFSDRSRQLLLDAVTGKGKEKRKNRDLKLEVQEKIHKCSNGKPGIPAMAFKRALVEMSPYVEGLDKKRVRGSVYVIGDLVPLKYKKMTVHKTLGRDAGINRAPREIWRPMFDGWSCELNIRYNAAQMTPQQIVELLKLAGFQNGAGGWRPQCGGQFGMFSVA